MSGGNVSLTARPEVDGVEGEMLNPENWRPRPKAILPIEGAQPYLSPFPQSRIRITMCRFGTRKVLSVIPASSFRY